METRKALGRALALRKRDLSLEWHRQLQRRLALDPERVFPSDGLTKEIPDVIEWIANRLHRDAAAEELEPRLRPLVRLRREQGHFLQEIMVEFRILGQILADGLVADIETHHATMSPARAARISCELADAVQQVVTVVGALYREEEVATERAGSRRLDEYGRILAHELIDPLTSADLATQALITLDLTDGERLREFAERVQTAVRRAARVVEGVRSLTLSVDEQDAPPRIDELRAVVQRVIDENRPVAADAHVEIRIGAIPDVTVDGGRVELVLHNILGNAVKYADREKEERWARVDAALDQGTLRVEVADNGLGIPEEEQGRIFDRFYRAHHDAGDGHGLGLAIAREAVQQIGGEIRCESVPGEGSTFTFSLPADSHERVAAN